MVFNIGKSYDFGLGAKSNFAFRECESVEKFARRATQGNYSHSTENSTRFFVTIR